MNTYMDLYLRPRLRRVGRALGELGLLTLGRSKWFLSTVKGLTPSIKACIAPTCAPRGTLFRRCCALARHLRTNMSQHTPNMTP